MYALSGGNRDDARRILERVSIKHPYWLYSRSWATALLSRWDGDDPKSSSVDSDPVPQAGVLPEGKKFEGYPR
jgi:hypothetical protein